MKILIYLNPTDLSDNPSMSPLNTLSSKSTRKSWSLALFPNPRPTCRGIDLNPLIARACLNVGFFKYLASLADRVDKNNMTTVAKSNAILDQLFMMIILNKQTNKYIPRLSIKTDKAVLNIHYPVMLLFRFGTR